MQNVHLYFFVWLDFYIFFSTASLGDVENKMLNQH